MASSKCVLHVYGTCDVNVQRRLHIRILILSILDYWNLENHLEFQKKGLLEFQGIPMEYLDTLVEYLL